MTSSVMSQYVLPSWCSCVAGLNEFLDNLGLGLLTQQLKDLDLGELMDTPPPGVDEAIAISKVRVLSGV